jgi:DNA-binding phage protein
MLHGSMWPRRCDGSAGRLRPGRVWRMGGMWWVILFCHVGPPSCIIPQSTIDCGIAIGTIAHMVMNCKSEILTRREVGMVDGHFDAAAFFAALDAVREARKMTWKQVAAESQVSASTLTRLAQGRRPDVDSLAKLLSWSGLKAEQFIRGGVTPPRKAGTMAMISTYLRADPHLTPESAAALEELVKVTYRRLRKG